MNGDIFKYWIIAYFEGGVFIKSYKNLMDKIN
jgi:hypothetical protein